MPTITSSRTVSPLSSTTKKGGAVKPDITTSPVVTSEPKPEGEPKPGLSLNQNGEVINEKGEAIDKKLNKKQQRKIRQALEGAEKLKAEAEAKAKKDAPKGEAKPAKKDKPAKTEGKVTIRARVFEALNANPLTGRGVAQLLGLKGIPNLLKDEGVCPKPRIQREVKEGVRGVIYSLTKLGKDAIKNGTVDSEAAPVAVGQDWTDAVSKM